MSIDGGANITIGGCTIKSCSCGVFVNDGHRNTVVGNDKFNLVHYLVLMNVFMNCSWTVHSQSQLMNAKVREQRS